MRPALGPTAEEFVDEVLAPTMVAMDKLLKGKAGKRSQISKRESVIYSFDGAGIHETSRTPQAASSPGGRTFRSLSGRPAYLTLVQMGQPS